MGAASVPKVIQHHNDVDIQAEAAESGNRDIRSSGNFVLAEIEKRCGERKMKQGLRGEEEV